MLPDHGRTIASVSPACGRQARLGAKRSHTSANIIDHEGLQRASPFSTVLEGRNAVQGQLNDFAETLRAAIAPSEWEAAFDAKRAVRLVALMGQATVSARFGTATLFMPVKVMTVLVVHPLPNDPALLVGREKGAWELLSELNEVLQSNP
jgi:hypothetical protein